MCALFSVMFFFLFFFGHLIATAVSPVEPEAHAERVWRRRQLDLDLRNLTVPQFKCGSFGSQPTAVWASTREDLVRTQEELLEVVRKSTAAIFCLVWIVVPFSSLSVISSFFFLLSSSFDV